MICKNVFFKYKLSAIWTIGDSKHFILSQLDKHYTNREKGIDSKIPTLNTTQKKIQAIFLISTHGHVQKGIYGLIRITKHYCAKNDILSILKTTL